MRTPRNGRTCSWCCLATGVLWGVIGPGVTLAEGGSFYVGVTAAAERLDVLYEKTVDNTPASNMTVNQGRVFQSDASAARAAFGVGFLGGYRMSLGPTGVYLSAEGDTAYHAGTVRGILPGAGASEGLNQLGENWPEDWSFDKDRSYGLTVRLGTGIPILGWGSGMSVYALVGLRRFKTGFRTDYTGCLNPEPCTGANELTSGTDRFDENFTGWVTGGGLEKRVGSIAIRGELRFTDFGSAGRVIPFDAVGVKVPLSLDPSGVGLRAALLWYF